MMNMFYQEEMDKAFRFGDILKGFVLSSSEIYEPILKANYYGSYKVNITIPEYCAILTPCCSIGDKVILLTPLVKINKKFFENPYFAENLTRINLRMDPEQSVSPVIWEKFADEEKEKRLAVGKRYAVLEYFIYERNQLFSEYSLGDIITGYYMIDFRNMFKINCDRIPNQKQVPLEAKCLQLSIDSRRELREKLGYYFFRPAAEDEIRMEI